MTVECPTTGQLVQPEINRFATQYREATNLKALASSYLSRIEDAALVVCAVPDYFDILSAVGEQLTFIGKRLGFPRCHCVCDVQPVFGFECVGVTPSHPLAGFCDPGSSWAGCYDGGTATLCIYDDGAYRGHLLARRYQMLGLYDEASLNASLQAVWGSGAKFIPSSVTGEIIVAPGRDLTSEEANRLPVTLRALPIIPGITILVHYGTAPVFGFGEGWSGFCDGEFICPAVVDPYGC